MAEVNSDDDDDNPRLSGQALEALAEFYSERDLEKQKFADLKSIEDGASKDVGLSMEAFGEDWNVSQFWYSDETAAILAEQLLDGATNDSWIAVVSAPSVFIQLKKLLALAEYPACPRIRLLEFDGRFDVFSEFVPYDYRQPLRLPPELKGRFDRVICDPPFLSADCQTKGSTFPPQASDSHPTQAGEGAKYRIYQAAVTVRWLSKASSIASEITTTARDEQGPDVRLVVCTGETMQALVARLHVGVRKTTFEPQHAKGRLSNEFRCYANFECKSWKWNSQDGSEC